MRTVEQEVKDVEAVIKQRYAPRPPTHPLGVLLSSSRPVLPVTLPNSPIHRASYASYRYPEALYIELEPDSSRKFIGYAIDEVGKREAGNEIKDRWAMGEVEKQEIAALDQVYAFLFVHSRPCISDAKSPFRSPVCTSF